MSITHFSILACTVSTLLMTSPAKAVESFAQCRFQMSPEASASPMTYQVRSAPEGAILLVQGKIDLNESKRLEHAIQQVITQGPIGEIWLNSGGGNAYEGLAMGRVLRRMGIPARVPRGAFCFSACSYAFVGAPFRDVDDGAEYGMHMFTALPSHLQDLAQTIDHDMTKQDRKLTQTQNKIQSIEQSSADFARLVTDYMREMGVSSEVIEKNFKTDNAGGTCPSREVLKRWHIINPGNY